MNMLLQDLPVYKGSDFYAWEGIHEQACITVWMVMSGDLVLEQLPLYYRML